MELPTLGEAVMALSGAHTAFAITVWAMDWNYLLIPGQAPGSVAFDVAAWSWFTALGSLLFLLGWALDWGIRVTGSRPPRPLLVVVCGFCLAGGLIWPISGFWIGLGLAGAALFSAGRNGPAPSS